MKKIILFLLVAVMFSSCIKNTPMEGDRVPVVITLGSTDGATRGGPFETDVNRVRVIMFRVSDGKFMFNDYFDNITANKITINTFTGTYDMYYIINEPLSGGNPTAAYSSIYQKSQINALKLAYTTPSSSPWIPTDIPMFKLVQGQVIGVSNSLTVSPERTMAKVLVDMVVDRSDFVGGDYPEITSVTIKGLPAYNYMVSAVYDGSTYAVSESQTVAPITVATKDTYNHELYVPEYIIGGSTKNAIIEITGKTKVTGLNCKWTQELGDKMSGNPAHTKYDIRRNTEYQFIGKVKGLGEHDLFVTTKIEGWTEVNNNSIVNGNHYIRFSSREASFTQFGIPAKNDGSVNTTKYIISLKTNFPTLSVDKASFSNVTAAAGEGSWSGPTGVIASTSTWTNGHFTVVGNKGATVGEETAYTFEITSNKSIVPDPMRETIFEVYGANLTSQIRIMQELPMGYRLVGNPDPSQVISTDGTAKRYPINIYSTHDYQVAINNATMIPAVYSQQTGGLALNVSSIDKSVTTLWVDITAYPSNITPRLANLVVSHVDVASTAPALSYTIVQMTPYLTADIGGLTNAEVPRVGGTVTINVVSNLARWDILDFKVDGVSTSTSVLNRTMGVGNNTVVLTLEGNPAFTSRTYTISFKDASSALTTSTLTITHKGSQGIPANPAWVNATGGVISWDPVAGLNLDGKGEIVYFKWGSLIGLSSDATLTNYNTASTQTKEYFIVYRPTGYNTTPATFESIPYGNSAYPNSFPPQNLAVGIGDPCKLATKGGAGKGTFKMPTGNPLQGFGTSASYINVGAGGGNLTKWLYNANGGATITNIATGTFTLTGAAATAFGTTMVLPVSGARLDSGTAQIGTHGCYWTNTFVNATVAYALGFNVSEARPSTTAYRGTAYAVRCVK